MQDKLNIDHDKWHFEAGKKEEIFSISKNYMSIVLEDPDALVNVTIVDTLFW
ncbi:MAG: hypothetical protein IPN87_15685 [Saprospiraceae bacterium]|nr:hypothetical protein [Candidatus Brachybacter algidus]